MISSKKQWLENAYVSDYEKLYQYSIADPNGFWESVAQELLWFKPWNKILEWNYPYARWFVGGETNIVYNALDRWIKTPIADKPALIWVGQNQKEEKYTYRQLNEAVCRFANGLRTLGVKKGDRVTIYLPRIPHQFIAMLACLKIGAIHSVVYSGFSFEALKKRIEDAQAKVVITADWYPYKDKVLYPLKNVQEAVKNTTSVNHIIVVSYPYEKNPSVEKINLFQTSQAFLKYHLWDDLVKKQDSLCPTSIMASTDPAFILYTSGTTGKPKGIVHGHGGYLVGVYATAKYVFNLHLSQSKEIFWSTADAGWITGHSYILYGPLLNGSTTFVYEGTPDFPDIEIWWRLIDKYKITHFYTAPTAIRMLMRHGEEPLKKYSFSSLKILGSVGEPINPEAWLWFYKNVGRENCPILDTWWQTETGMHILTPFISTPLKPGSCFKPFFGIIADVVDEKGKSVEKNKQGYLIIKTPWPAMLLDLWQNQQKYKETYFGKIPNPDYKTQNYTHLKNTSFESKEKIKNDNIITKGYSNFLYFTGDSAKIDNDGFFWIIGRNDDVIKVSGHRLGSAELESAFVAHQAVAEAAVIGLPDEIKGEKIKAFVILKIGHQPSDELKTELKNHVRKFIGPIATPDEIEFVEKLPKTRSGKIMRRVLKAQSLNQPVGDISTLED